MAKTSESLKAPKGAAGNPASQGPDSAKSCDYRGVADSRPSNSDRKQSAK
jgi:hypothetical protein